MRAQETQMLGGMPKSLEKMTSKIKWVCPNIVKKKEAANQRRAAKENMNDVKSQTVDSDPQSLKPWNTLWALWILSFIAKNHSLRYVPVEVLSNQASKQPRTINNALKMQRILFHKIHNIKNKLLIIIYADKNECLKREELFFSNKISSFFSSPSLWKQKGHLMTYFHQKTSLPNTRVNNLFFKKKKELQDFKSKLF